MGTSIITTNRTISWICIAGAMFFFGVAFGQMFAGDIGFTACQQHHIKTEFMQQLDLMAGGQIAFAVFLLFVGIFMLRILNALPPRLKQWLNEEKV